MCIRLKKKKISLHFLHLLVCYTYSISNHARLQALVYDILPSTTAIFSYAIGSRKLLANINKQFFVGAQTVVSLLQTTQIICLFYHDHVASSNKTRIIWFETELLLLPRVDVSHVYVHAWVLGSFHSLISTQTFRRALTSSVGSCVEI